MDVLSSSRLISMLKNRPRPAAYWRPACCCVFPFLAKIRKFKMAAIFGEGKIFLKLTIVHSSYTLGVENFDKIALSRTVKEIEAILCFSIFGENFEMATIFAEGKIF